MSGQPEPANLHKITSTEQFQSLLSQDLQRVSLVSFWVSWERASVQFNDVVAELAKKNPALLVLQVEAEAQEDIANSFDVAAVPDCYLLRGHTLLERVQGADPAALRKVVEMHVDAPPPIVALSHTDQVPAPPPTTVSVLKSQEQLEKRLRDLMKQSKIVLFMKGEPDQPQCGFSRKAVALLQDQGTEFTHFDILTDESVRAGLKKLNDWPTYPQFIVNGEFIGGLDVVTEMVANGEFTQIVA